MTATPLYWWRVRTHLPERQVEVCRVLARDTLNSCLVEFVSDGWRCITSRNYLRRVRASNGE